jgi:lipoprotein NlpI
MSIAIKNRGRAHFYLGHYAEAVADHREGLRYDSTNAFLVLWLYMLQKHIGPADTATLAAQLMRTDTVNWPAPVGRFFLGRISPDQLTAAAERPDPTTRRDQRCEDFFIGEWLLWQQKHAEAKSRFEKARAKCPSDASEYQGAVAELKRQGASGETGQARLNR